jgi:hypothetical protein
MSNRKRARWTEAQIDATNAEALLGELAEEIQADAARDVIGGGLLARLRAQGADPDLIADLEGKIAGGGVDYWAAVYREAMTSR